MRAGSGYIDDENASIELLEALERGGVVVVPTDTLYGFSTAVRSEEGYRRILKLKRCPEMRNFLLLAASLEMAERYIASWGCTSKEELGAIWPAPLTAILPTGPGCPAWVAETVALRVPDFEPLLEIISRLGEPILSTSVNLSGAPPLHTPEEIEELFGEGVDFIARSRTSLQDLPSTIVDFTGAEPVLVRQGSYPW